jgi:hypothetical protein
MIAQKTGSINQLKREVFTPKGAAEPARRPEAALLPARPIPAARKRPARSPEEPGDFFQVRVEYVLPFFFAALIALNLCALIVLRGFSGFRAAPPPPQAVSEPEILVPEPFQGLSSAFLQEPETARDPVSEYYRDPLFRDLVTDFFSRITASREIAELILSAAETHAVPLSLAFSVAWEESRYRPRAINAHNRDGSIDRGLFQLNSRSFPKLSEADFFDPRINTGYGIAHLRWCLDTGGSVIVALSMYNAGSVRVNAGGTPRATLEYAGRVLSSCRKIDSLFEAEIARIREENPRAPVSFAEPEDSH